MLTIRAEQIDALTTGTRAGRAVARCPRRATWVEVALVGEDDRPIPGERYRLTLADGSVRVGALDAGGFARIEGVDPDRCVLEFPDLDVEAVTRVG